MSIANKVGIWMDHASAHVMEFTADSIETKIIQSRISQEHENSANKSESLIHSKEQHQQSEFYKKLGEVIKRYEEVVLFGPTNAKVELFNILTKDHHFEKIKIHVKNADNMTENQQHAFVRSYYSGHASH